MSRTDPVFMGELREMWMNWREGGKITVPSSKLGVDRLREAVLALPDGLLAKLYVDLYEAKNLRIDSAKSAAKTYYGGLA